MVAVELGGYLDIADVLLVTLDAHGRVSHINRRGCQLLGWAESDVVGQDWFEHFVPATVRDSVRDVFRQIMAGQVQLVERYENPVLTRAGEARLLAWHNAPVRAADGRIVGTISSGLDVTQRQEDQRAREHLLKELADVKFALDQSAIVATTDVTGRITFVNDKFCEISKYAREELLGQDHRIINSGYHSKDFIRNLWTTIAGGRIWRGEIRNRAKDGSIYWVDTTIVPFVSRGGKPYQYMAIRYEVTERKAAEARLQHQDTLARLGEMAAVVAHEVKNPLAGISGALQVIASRLPADGGDRAVLEDIQKRIGSLNHMVQDLLLFARPTAPALAATPLAALLDEVVSVLHRDPAFTHVDVMVTGAMPTLQLDQNQLRIVLHNLLLNAAQAMGGRGTVEVSVGATDEGFAIAIADRGPGLSPDVLDKMFEPFFTTKHRGSGLGLPTARRMVEAHGGELNAHARPEGGTVLTITLPR